MLATNLILLPFAAGAHLLNLSSEIDNPSATIPTTVSVSYTPYQNQYSQGSPPSQIPVAPTMTDSGSSPWRPVTPSVTPITTALITATVVAPSGSGDRTSVNLPKTTSSSAAAETVGVKMIMGFLGLMIGIGMLV